MKKFTLLLTLLLAVMGVKADTETDFNYDLSLEGWGWSYNITPSTPVLSNNVITGTISAGHTDGAIAIGWGSGSYQDWSAYSKCTIVVSSYTGNTWLNISAKDSSGKLIFNKNFTYDSNTRSYAVDFGVGSDTGYSTSSVNRIDIAFAGEGSTIKIGRVYLTKTSKRKINAVTPSETPGWGWSSSYNSDTRLISFSDAAWNAYGFAPNIENTSSTYKSLVMQFEPLSASVEFDINGSKNSDIAKDATCAIANISAVPTIESFGIKNSAVGQKVRLKSAYLSQLSVEDETAYINAHDYPLITSLGYTTHVTNRDIDFTDSELEAYIAKTIGDENITFTKVTSVPSGTALLLKGNAGCYEFEKGGLETEDVSTNKLKESNGSVAGATTKYVLSKSGDNAVFAPTDGLSIPKGRAYIDTSIELARLFISFDDSETTSINKVVSPNPVVANDVYYNLNGQRVAQPSKGLYIVNGKKVIIK